MVWKQDLAKLKKEFKAEEGPAPKAPPPKPAPVAAPRVIEEEDALFLAAMGKAPRRPAATPVEAIQPPPVPKALAPAPVPAEDFGEAMGSLKGLKRLPEAPVRKAAEVPKPLVTVPEPAQPRLVEAAVAVPTPEPAPEPLPEPIQAPEAGIAPIPQALPGPQLIQLAAGMAIEVDGSLDLRGHSAADGLERLRERIQDGRFLGWRTLHVQLGPDAALREAFLAHLAGSEARTIGRYAQAPIPMGGSQAWILYFAIPSTPKAEA